MVAVGTVRPAVRGLFRVCESGLVAGFLGYVSVCRGQVQAERSVRAHEERGVEAGLQGGGGVERVEARVGGAGERVRRGRQRVVGPSGRGPPGVARQSHVPAEERVRGKGAWARREGGMQPAQGPRAVRRRQRRERGLDPTAQRSLGTAVEACCSRGLTEMWEGG